MSESSSDGDSSAGEVALVVLCLLALLFSAAFLPAFDLFQMGGAAGGGSLSGPPLGGGGSTDVGSNASHGSENGRRARSTVTSPGRASATNGRGSAGSPTGADLSTPPSRTRIGTTSNEPVTSVPQVPLFVVESSRRTYWRQAAYTTYTGRGWKRSVEWRSMRAGVPHDDLTADGTGLVYRVRLLAGATSLPTVWQPESARLPGRNATLQASTVGGVRSVTTLPENTTYVARSSRPPRRPGLLRRAGRDYPDRIERIYTRLPPSTPDRVEEFTARVASGAETPYGVAVAVRDWLQSHKEYSLNASHEPGGSIAAQFLFEMERGYCQYFATTMAVMLRTQGIPARYVVGFAGGRPVGRDQYLVTSDTAHAWVEVYFPDVGWVRFDPTPSGGTVPVENPRPPYEITLNRSAVAGATVAITVEKNGSPVVGAPVSVEGDRVGWTGAAGEVTTRLPYVANVTITARPPGAASKYSDDGATADRTGRLGSPSMARSKRVFDLAEPGEAIRPAPGVNGSSRTYESETNVTIRVSGDPVVGEAVTVNATIEGVPVRGATVTLDGTAVGTTNDSGRFVLSLSGVAPGEHRIGISRRVVSGRVTIDVRRPTPETSTTVDATGVTVTVSAPFGLPVPAGPGTVTVRRSGHPVTGASVIVGGTPVGETGPNGTLAIQFPIAASARIVVRGPEGTTAETTVAGLYRTVVLGLGAVLVVCALLIALARRRGITARSVSRRMSRLVSTIGRAVVDVLLRLGDGVVRSGSKIRSGFARLRTWLASVPGTVATDGLAVVRLFDPRRVLRRLVRWLRTYHRRTRSAASDGTDASAGERPRSPATRDDDRERPLADLRDLWREFVSLVRPPRLATRTPGEIARYAIDRGFPERPVRALTDLYRDAEYGSAAASDSRLDRAREALAAIRNREEDEDRARVAALVAAILALAAIGFGVTVAYSPDRLPRAARRAVLGFARGIEPRTAMLSIGAVVALVGLLSSWSWRAEGRSGSLAERQTELPDREATVAGAELTSAFEHRRRGDDVDMPLEDGALSDALRGVVVDVYAVELGDRETAERHVDEGRWTDDRYAAAFLATSDAVDYPVRHRLYAWLYPGEAYERRAKRALREAESDCEHHLSGYDAPDRTSGWFERVRSTLDTNEDEHR